MSFVSRRANLLKISVKMSMVISGWITTQTAPISVCLYRTLISRKVRKYRSSRYAQRSPRLSWTPDSSDSITTRETSSGAELAEPFCALLEVGSREPALPLLSKAIELSVDAHDKSATRERSG